MTEAVTRRYVVIERNERVNDKGVAINEPITLNFRRGDTRRYIFNQVVNLTDADYACFPNYFKALDSQPEPTPAMTSAEKTRETQKSLLFDSEDGSVDEMSSAVADKIIDELIPQPEPVKEEEKVVEPVKTRVMTERESFYHGVTDIDSKRKKLTEKILNNWTNEDIAAELISIGLEAIGSRKVRIKKILNKIDED